jgi:DNA-directed RNA polymerase subunit RPC12/RpoP
VSELAPRLIPFGECSYGGWCRHCHRSTLVGRQFWGVDGMEVTSKYLAVRCDGCGYRSVVQFSGRRRQVHDGTARGSSSGS